MRKTFAQLGIPFPLFQGPVEQAGEYVGLDLCSICGAKGQHCFGLGIGCAVIAACPKCATDNGLDACDKEAASCRQCGGNIPFLEHDDEEFKACYACLRSGRAAISKDTELGMISREQAFNGVTHGGPGLNRTDFEMVPKEDNWVGARLPQAMMFELIRTPTYSTIQGERWQFCCRQPMLFLGEWSRQDFFKYAPDSDGHRFFQQIVQRVIPGLWEDNLHDITGVYVFRCPGCGRMTAHWDIA
jgi:uncharacterized protein CbrC (UPF0167 family)